MSDTKAHSTNFIRGVIDKDLASGRCVSVHTRFSPEPNGYLHIGHAKSICLNFGIAQDYHGTCYLRFDDTNPVKENIEYVNSIQQDIKWLGFDWSGNVRYASDYFDFLYNYALELINKGLAYVDKLSSDEIRNYRGTLKSPGKNSPYRNNTIEENQDLFLKMREGRFAEGRACLRAKIDMASPVIVMRDPVLYRIKFTQHHQTGDKWCIYPMYDFTHCITDALEGITHSLCTLEFQDNRKLYNWVLSNTSIASPHPRQYEFSRLNLEYSVMSKRKLHILVKENIVDGWDDPRMPTISGLRRRGYTAAAIREFCRRVGVTKQDNNIEASALESCIREDLNYNALRAMAVIDPVQVIIESLPLGYEQIVMMPNHPYRPDMGKRSVVFSREIYIDRSDFREAANSNYKRLVLGGEVRLRNICIIKAQRIEKNNQGKITTIFCCHDHNSLNQCSAIWRKVKGIIHWVSSVCNIPAEFRLYDRLFTDPNPDRFKDPLLILNKSSLITSKGFIEANLLSINMKAPVQFEREGYFFADIRDSSPSCPVFNRIVRLRDNL